MKIGKVSRNSFRLPQTLLARRINVIFFLFIYFVRTNKKKEKHKRKTHFLLVYFYVLWIRWHFNSSHYLLFITSLDMKNYFFQFFNLTSLKFFIPRIKHFKRNFTNHSNPTRTLIITIPISNSIYSANIANFAESKLNFIEPNENFIRTFLPLPSTKKNRSRRGIYLWPTYGTFP